MATRQISQQGQNATVYMRSLNENVRELLLWELFLQLEPVVNTHKPKDGFTGQQQGCGFMEFLSEEMPTMPLKLRT